MYDLPSGAVLDETRMYRYRLWREVPPHEDIAQDKISITWIMLNPSTADEVENDPTVKKCLGYSARWGYQSMVVVNLFAFRTDSPAELKQVKDREKAVGPLNDAYIDYEARNAEVILCGWGNDGRFLGRGTEVLARLRSSSQASLYYLNLTKPGHPEHPLYKKYSLVPKLFSVG